MISPEEIVPGVFRFEKIVKQGWSLNMLAVTLPENGLLLYSPTWVGPGTFEALDKLGEVRALVAPNHFHHLSLRRFQDRYSHARAVASHTAMVRLEKQGHEGLGPLSEIAPLLAPGSHFVVPDGTKNGEAWLSIPGEDGPVWLVCDAWFNVTRRLEGLYRVMLHVLRVAPGLEVSHTFRLLGIRDVRAYVSFTTEALDREKPCVLALSHGDPIRSMDGKKAYERAREILMLRLG